MFDTKTRVYSRVNWKSAGGPKLETCDLAYSIMETPFRRDVVKELCSAGHRRNLKIALYFSHPDWYDAIPARTAITRYRSLLNSASRALHQSRTNVRARSEA